MLVDVVVVLVVTAVVEVVGVVVLAVFICVVIVVVVGCRYRCRPCCQTCVRLLVSHPANVLFLQTLTVLFTTDVSCALPSLRKDCSYAAVAGAGPEGSRLCPAQP